LTKQKRYRAHGILPNDRAAPELMDDWTCDVARVPPTRESNNSQAPS
jgi:hypothetical protein